jgi:hypothetical protein
MPSLNSNGKELALITKSSSVVVSAIADKLVFGNSYTFSLSYGLA